MAWLTEEEFKEIYYSSMTTEIPSSQNHQCLDGAVERIARLCGVTVIDEISSGANTDRKVKSFRRAQGKFAYAAILPLVGQRLKDGGVVTRETDNTSNSTVEFAKSSELQASINLLEKQALEEIEAYLTPAEVAREESFRFVGSFSVKKNIVW